MSRSDLPELVDEEMTEVNLDSDANHSVAAEPACQLLMVAGAEQQPPAQRRTQCTAAEGEESAAGEGSRIRLWAAPALLLAGLLVATFLRHANGGGGDRHPARSRSMGAVASASAIGGLYEERGEAEDAGELPWLLDALKEARSTTTDPSAIEGHWGFHISGLGPKSFHVGVEETVVDDVVVSGRPAAPGAKVTEASLGPQEGAAQAPSAAIAAGPALPQQQQQQQRPPAPKPTSSSSSSSSTSTSSSLARGDGHKLAVKKPAGIGDVGGSREGPQGGDGTGGRAPGAPAPRHECGGEDSRLFDERGGNRQFDADMQALFDSLLGRFLVREGLHREVALLQRLLEVLWGARLVHPWELHVAVYGRRERRLSTVRAGEVPARLRGLLWPRLSPEARGRRRQRGKQIATSATPLAGCAQPSVGTAGGIDP
eukprot:CAMPEP_0115412026 /NCGR_PEP_ID=MMETSP0271-20121206/21339_1 /TAXON_ID=71861 /ORGANISM="Scrippsiella trochoidea, Strain CCMP3099" /LENGTH=427 /DNA_ID=CAMNT_0002836255 /DNA_START=110 /DNA_END=1389 /DNA_ORIENTATION=-